jgi:hypothetical protein
MNHTTIIFFDHFFKLKIVIFTAWAGPAPAHSASLSTPWSRQKSYFPILRKLPRGQNFFISSVIYHTTHEKPNILNISSTKKMLSLQKRVSLQHFKSRLLVADRKIISLFCKHNSQKVHNFFISSVQ